MTPADGENYCDVAFEDQSNGNTCLARALITF